LNVDLVVNVQSLEKRYVFGAALHEDVLTVVHLDTRVLIDDRVGATAEEWTFLDQCDAIAAVE
jgi:hypothetical protein